MNARSIILGILIAGLVVWAACAPIVWILRDGLGPGMVETEGMQTVAKFLGIWGIPALVLVVPLVFVTVMGRRSDGSSEAGD